jgi:Mrp family chromosome partitioning ATPase
MRLVSGVVIVSRVNTTTRDAARHMSGQLRKLKAPTLGVVANAVAIRGGGYYGYGYGYYADGYEPHEAVASPHPEPQESAPAGSS